VAVPRAVTVATPTPRQQRIAAVPVSPNPKLTAEPAARPQRELLKADPVARPAAAELVLKVSVETPRRPAEAVKAARSTSPVPRLAAMVARPMEIRQVDH